MKEIGNSASWSRRVGDGVAAYAFSTLRRALAAIARPASLVGLVSLAFSAASLYVTVLEQPRLKVFAGCNWQYGRGPGSFDEYFVIPVTFVNTGARGGTVLAVELLVEKASSPRPFVGRFTEESFDDATRQLFAPVAIDGHGSVSRTMVFTERTRTGPPLFDIAAFNRPERFRATLTFQPVAHVTYPVIDRLLASPPAEAQFEPLLRPADIAPIFADKRAGFDACAPEPANLAGKSSVKQRAVEQQP